MDLNEKNEATLVNTYAGQCPRSLAYILLAILVSLGIQLLGFDECFNGDSWK